MGRVIEVKFLQPSERRGRFFPARKIYFPPLRRLAITWELKPDVTSVLYTLNPDYPALGSIETEIVDHVRDENSPSAVVRLHANLEEASCYLEGARDAGMPDYDQDIIVRTDQGVFTCMRRPTPSHNPVDCGPYVFHCGFYPIDPPYADEDYWECRTDRLGHSEEGEFLHPDPDEEGED
jgi:hypothetical protein